MKRNVPIVAYVSSNARLRQEAWSSCYICLHKQRAWSQALLYFKKILNTLYNLFAVLNKLNFVGIWSINPKADFHYYETNHQLRWSILVTEKML